MTERLNADDYINYLSFVASVKDYTYNDFKKKIEVIQEKQLSLFDTTTPQEERILNKIYEFEEKYFSDLTLMDCKKDLTSYREKVSNKWKTVYGEFYIEEKISFVDKNWRIIFIDELLGLGCCGGEEKIIGIAESVEDYDPTLLHEMIHGYEFMLEPYPCYHQYVLIKLYEKLSIQIPNLYKFFTWDLHINNTVNHSPLFLLKSLDLDIRLKLPYGTVYGYGREYVFRKFNPYAVKYRPLNSNEATKYYEFFGGSRFRTVDEARDFIQEYQRKRIKKAKSKMIGFFPELARPKPLEYSIYKMDKDNRYTNLIETIKDKDILDSCSMSN